MRLLNLLTANNTSHNTHLTLISYNFVLKHKPRDYDFHRDATRYDMDMYRDSNL